MSPSQAVSSPVRVQHPRKLPVWEFPGQRIPVGAPGEYKPNLALLPNGEMVLVAFHRVPVSGVKTFHEVTSLWWSNDDGESWSERRILEDVLGREAFLSSTSEGTLFLTTHIYPSDSVYAGHPDSAHAFLHRSTDGGRTWERTLVLLEGEFRNGLPHEGHATATARNVVELPDGKLHLGVSINNMGRKLSSAPAFNAFIWSSNDDGTTWNQNQRVEIESSEFDDIAGFFDEGFIYRNQSGKLFYWRGCTRGQRSYVLPDTRVAPTTETDQVRRMIWWESDNDGLKWTCRGNFGDYGQMYPRVTALRDGRTLMTFTQRDILFPFSLRARLGSRDSEEWEFEYDQIIIEGLTPWGFASGGGFGNTVQLEDGLLVSTYSYIGTDAKTHVEIVRWKLPTSADDVFQFPDPMNDHRGDPEAITQRD